MTESTGGAIDRSALPTHTFDWGLIKWLVSPGGTPGAKFTLGEVVILPGAGHTRHNHPDEEEILYILSGEAEQMVADGEPFPVRGGDVIYIPAGVFHSTINTGWEPVRLIAIYNPGGPEVGLTTLEDYREVAPGEAPQLVRGS